MAPRRVVADSDDDEDEDTFSPVKIPIEAPEPEPLSPLHQPSSPVDELAAPTVSEGHVGSSNRISDKTSTSFFASIYNEQQKGVLQQSHLIENIVRQSQKASASGEDLSLPGKNKTKSGSPGTDVSSPIVLDRPVSHQSMFSDDTTQLTTPRKGAGNDMWDVPSSVESSRGKKKTLTTYGKRKRSNSVLTTGSAGAVIFNNGKGSIQDQDDQAVEDVVVDDARQGGDEFIKPSPLPARKKSKVSLYDATPQNSTTFYVAQSNLTTMQKLEYQRVNVPPTNPYTGVAGSLPNQNSTCASTIAYSTPSLYASSGPPLPWEVAAAEPQQPETSQHVIEIPSSPDVMASGHDRPKRRNSISASHTEAVSPLPDLSETPAGRKRKKKSKHIEEVDELGQDESWDSDTIGFHRETYTPCISRRRSNATSIHEDETAQHEEVEEPVNVVDMGVEEEPENPVTETLADPIEDNSASNTATTALEAPVTTEQETLPTTQPKKKRGRKKKQPIVEEAIQDEQPTEEPTTPAELDPPFQATEVEEVSEKPKRKRGRPRKSDQAKATEIDAPPEPVEAPEEPAGKTADDDYHGASPEEDEEKPKSKKTAKKQKKKDNIVEDIPREDESPALKEIGANSITPSRSMSSEPASKKSKDVPATTENSKVKSQAKEPPKPAVSQSKSLYRVGLSKKSRIAPLLKCIKK